MPHLPSHFGGTGCCCRKYSSSSPLSPLPLVRQERDHVALLLRCFISVLSLHSFFLSFKHPWCCCQIHSPALPSDPSAVSCEDYVTIFPSCPSHFPVIIISVLSLSSSSASLRIDRVAGGWRDDWEEEAESAEQVDRVLLKLEMACQGHCTSICPSVFEVHPFGHHPIFSLARRNVRHPHLRWPKIPTRQLLPSLSSEGRRSEGEHGPDRI